MKRSTLQPTLVLGCLASAAVIVTAAPTARTSAAFDRYVALTERRIDSEVASGQAFLWIDTLQQSRRTELLKDLQAGTVLVEGLETREGAKEIDAQDGLIHHWVGTVFVPRSSVRDAVALMQDYDHHSRYFAPAIAASKTLQHSGNRFRVALRFHIKKVISVTMDTENDAEFFFPAPDRAYSRIRSTRVSEIANAGTPQEAAKPSGEENGFMWNLNTYWRFAERHGGVYIQCESLTLSRDVPLALAWILRPIVSQMPRESLTFTLAKARDALGKTNQN